MHRPVGPGLLQVGDSELTGREERLGELGRKAEHRVVAALTGEPFRWTQTFSLTPRFPCSLNPSGGGAELKPGENQLSFSKSLALSTVVPLHQT